MTAEDENLTGREIIRWLETRIKKTLDEFRNPDNSNFSLDPLMSSTTPDYIEYLRLAREINQRNKRIQRDKN